MQTTFEKAIKVIEELSPSDFRRLKEWFEKKKNKEPLKAGTSPNDLYKRRMRWLKENRERYGGQYVALDGDRLLGVAKSYPEGRKIAVEAGFPDAFVDYLSKPDEEGFMGGW